MKYRLAISFFIVFLFFTINSTAYAQQIKEGTVNWVEGYISAVGEGTATPSGDRAKDQLRAIRAATILAQRALLETTKGVKIDSQTKVENRMVQEDVINTRIEGTIQGAGIVKQDVRWEGDTPIATVEMRICLNGTGVCQPETSIVNALALSQKDEPVHAPKPRLDDISPKEETKAPSVNDQAQDQKDKPTPVPLQQRQGDTIQKQEATAYKIQNIVYDSSKPVTGIIFNLQGLHFERVILPVVITIDDENKQYTVYSVKSVDPPVIQTYGVVRYGDSVEQAKQNTHLGNNVIVVPVSGITKENMLVIAFGVARVIRETTSHGNDYLKMAKVIIAAK